MAVKVKEKVNPELLLKNLKDMVENPPPKAESPKTGKDTGALAARELRNKLAFEKSIKENEEKQAKGSSHNTSNHKIDECHVCFWY